MAHLHDLVLLYNLHGHNPVGGVVGCQADLAEAPHPYNLPQGVAWQVLRTVCVRQAESAR